MTIAEHIAEALQPQEARLREQYRTSGHINSFYLDDLLPNEVAHKIYRAFPDNDKLVHNKSLREDKYVGVQMNMYDPVLEDCIFAFQDEAVVKCISRITELQNLIPDRNLYAGGISAMCHGQFLNPHLDNSHDKDSKNFRVLNLLYYVTPDWKAANGGNLELWDDGPKATQRTIGSLFNRLVVMVTNQISWHSVSPVVVKGRRCCVSNYYFSPVPADRDPTPHVTSFRTRPGEGMWKDVALQGDSLLRSVVKKATAGKVFKNPHVYKRDEK